MNPEFPCVVCSQNVRPRQEAMECDRCKRWQHRVKCTPDLTRQEYRRLCRLDSHEVQWNCRDCSLQPIAQETMETDIPGETQAEDMSFRIDREFEEPNDPMEDSIDDPIPEDVDMMPMPVTYHYVDEGTQKGKGRLVESTGFKYTVKECKGGATYWTCSVRKPVRCNARVIEKDGVFTKGLRDHIHPPVPDVLISSTVVRDVKRLARANVFRPATSIAESVLRETVTLDLPTPSVPGPTNLARTINRSIQLNRPDDPKDLDFEVSYDHLPEKFLRHDVKVGDQRHLVFYTDSQLSLLERTKTWYMDATFKVVDDPFYQLFSIHAFVKSVDEIKQVPLVFVLMSKKRRRDYKKVFQCLRDVLAPTSKLETAVADFEAGMWSGFRQVFHDIPIRGCSFHWNQAVFRKIQALGLEPAYNRDDSTRRFLRKVMSLPYLPAEHIRPMFEELRRHVESEALVDLMTYISDTWMSSSVWSVESWSVYGISIRTNNDVEGWHRRLNHAATRGNVQFYLLVPILHAEAEQVQLQMRMVSDGKLKRIQRKTTRLREGKIFDIWRRYREGNISTSQLLKRVATM